MNPHFVPEPIHIHNLLHLVGVAILYYDFLLTLGDEYMRIWKSRKTFVSCLFFINRYLPIFADMVVNWGNFHEFPTELGHYAFFRQVLLIVNQVVVCYILYLRTYALYGRSWRIGGSILVVSFSLLVISVWAVIGQHNSVELRGGCHTAANRITAIRLAVAWESLFLFDCLIFSLTLFKTLRERRRNPATSGKRDIVALVMRDGAMYFAVMASVNLANTLTFYVLEPLLRGCLSTAASSISVTMMSRLMLNLHSSAFARNELFTTHSGFTTESSENSTSLMLTSRISMPHMLSTTMWDAEGSRLYRESVYVRESHDRRDGGGYIEDVYELADYHARRDDDNGHLRVPLEVRGGIVVGKPIIGGREYYEG